MYILEFLRTLVLYSILSNKVLSIYQKENPGCDNTGYSHILVPAISYCGIDYFPLIVSNLKKSR